MPKAPKNLREFAGLLKVVEFLRGPDGCPWDKEQTHSSLTRFAIEEAHELADAIDSGNEQELKDELGDVLLQVVLHSEIARQEGRFDIFDVIENLNEKMVRRHPHVFGDVNVSSSDEVLNNWSEIKAKEKSKKVDANNPFDIPKGMPSLLRSQKIGEKTRKINFDWETVDGVYAKVQEELRELNDELQKGSVSRIESELGDVLFSLAQLARHLKLDSEQALRKTNQRFEKRFSKMRELVTAAGKDWSQLSSEEKEKFWQAAKSAELND